MKILSAFSADFTTTTQNFQPEIFVVLARAMQSSTGIQFL
jgi:hypothetical protein